MDHSGSPRPNSTVVDHLSRSPSEAPAVHSPEFLDFTVRKLEAVLPEFCSGSSLISVFGINCIDLDSDSVPQ